MQHNDHSFLQLLDTIRALRAENGCPWDKRQTTTSMIKYLRAECKELEEAIGADDPDNLREELGDVLFILLLMAEINHEQSRFSVDDVLRTINDKLVRRHPHVFAGVEINNEEELRQQWQQIKNMEKSQNLI